MLSIYHRTCTHRQFIIFYHFLPFSFKFILAMPWFVFFYLFFRRVFSVHWKEHICCISIIIIIYRYIIHWKIREQKLRLHVIISTVILYRSVCLNHCVCGMWIWFVCASYRKWIRQKSKLHVSHHTLCYFSRRF